MRIGQMRQGECRHHAHPLFGPAAANQGAVIS
jgi:hypothetical protein